MERVARVVLVGFSGTGKSTVAQLLSGRLGWAAIDTDDEVAARFGLDIPEVFRRYGEPAFRAAERSALGDALARDRVVVASGGGAVVDPGVWSNDLLGRPGTLVVALDARPETIVRRLRAQWTAEGGAAGRPLLAVADPLARVAELKSARQAAYDAAHITLVVDAVEPEAVADEIATLIREGAGEEPFVRLAAPSGTSTVHIALGAAERLGKLTRERFPTAERAWIVSDDCVLPRHGPAVERALQEENFGVRSHGVAHGEASKSLGGAAQLYDWLLDGAAERGDIVAALGGGVIGDLAGFVAATCLRGLGLVQIPTSLLAMVDSSVGGKTGINHRAGKNLIGAFYQPQLVVVDPWFLRTLPARELTSGWAEVVKHAVIQPSTPGGGRGDMLTFLERNARRLLALDEPAMSYLIRRNVALKAAVVEADEREAGVRAFLNFGHTLGHAIEAAGYRLLHGEAVALGMRAALRIGVAIGTCDDKVVARIDDLLDRFGLPSKVEADSQLVMLLTESDKKRAAGRQRWVLPSPDGGVSMRDGVPREVVRDALMTVIGEAAVVSPSA